MNYERIYARIVENARSRTLDNGIYTESHHIIPSCKGGSDDKDNLVELLPREHFLCHWLLHLMHPTDFHLLAAWNAFCRGKKREVSHNYERCRLKWIDELKKRKTTHPEWWKNWTKGAEGKVWVHLGNTSKRVLPTERQDWIAKGWLDGRASFKRSAHTTEHKNKISQRFEERKRSGWVDPKKGTKQIANVACQHCGKIGPPGQMSRWHGDNCKTLKG